MLSKRKKVWYSFLNSLSSKGKIFGILNRMEWYLVSSSGKKFGILKGMMSSRNKKFGIFKGI